MAKKWSNDASAAAKNLRRRAPNTSPDLATEREPLWEASAPAPADGAAETGLSPGVRAAVEAIFGKQESRLRRVAERGAADGSGTPHDVWGALAARYGMPLETLAERLDLSVEVIRSPFDDCPPALLAAVALALRATSGSGAAFAEVIRMAPSLTEEQRRHWLT